MKTKKELTAIKEEVAVVEGKLSALTEEEMAQVFGGAADEKLARYLRNIGPKKGDLLVDHGTGAKLTLDSTCEYDKAESLLIVKREKDQADVKPTMESLYEK